MSQNSNDESDIKVYMLRGADTMFIIRLIQRVNTEVFQMVKDL